jgi:hypothetical protein
VGDAAAGPVAVRSGVRPLPPGRPQPLGRADPLHLPAAHASVVDAVGGDHHLEYVPGHRRLVLPHVAVGASNLILMIISSLRDCLIE